MKNVSKYLADLNFLKIFVNLIYKCLACVVLRFGATFCTNSEAGDANRDGTYK